MARYYLDENGNLVEKKKKPRYKLTSDGQLVENKEEEEEDIAPVVTPTTTKKEDDDKLQFFQKSEGNWWQTILGTAGDAGLGIVKGVGKLGEGLTDLVGYGAAGLYDLFGADELAERQKKRTSESTIDNWTKGADDYLDKYSVLGRTSDAITQGIGQVAGIIATGGIAGAAGASGAVATAITTGVTGLSSMGAGVGEAYQSEYQAKEAYDKQIKDVDAQITKLKREDAVGYADAIRELEAKKSALSEAKDLAEVTDGEAWAYGAIKGVVDAGTELISGGLGKGVKATGLSHGIGGVDDMLAKKVSSVFQRQLTKNLAEYGVKASGEGFEEVLAGVGTAWAKSVTYMSEEDWSKLVEDENLLEQFVVGAITSGIAQGGDVIKDTKAGRDYVTKYSDTEQTVIDKVYENRLAEESKDGKKLTGREKSKIHDEVVREFERGDISTDTLEEILGGNTYKAYSDAVKSEESLVSQEKTLRDEFNTLNKMKQGEMTGEQVDRREALRSQLADLTKQIEDTKKSSTKAELKTKLSEEVFSLVKDTRLVESYNESARRSQAFTADLSQYDEKRREVVKKAIDSGILNNTRKTHEFVDMVAKISADKGVSFDFTDNAKLKESGFAVDGKFVNGYVTKDGVTLNIQSSKSLNSVVGHEITHVLEGTELYNALQQTVIKYAQSKGDYQGRYDALSKLYEGVEGANIDSEITADLVGDYLFTDEKFIRNLSTENRNLFQKIYDEVKYLVKVATAGSKEARELEKVKRAFDKAYRESGKEKADTETLYSLAMVEEVQPKTDGWQRGPSTDEVRAAHPTLYAVDEEATTERNPTQVKGTIGSYRKVYTALQNEGFNGTILDASSGLGYGTKAGVEEFGFDVEDIEPYPDSDYKPKYTDYSKLNKKYDVIISNAVLNVIPQDQRDALVVKMGELLNDGGRMFINVRGKDVLNASGKIAINEANMEYFIPRTAKTGSYQKGFTKPELVAYLEDALGDGFTVQPTNLFGAVSAIVTKNGGVQYSLTETEVKETNQKLGNVGLQYDAQSETVSFSLSSLEDAFHYNESETDYLAARKEYAEALAKATGKTVEEANRYLDSLFLIHDMIASDRDRLDYEAAVNRSAWVGNSEYGGSIDFSTLCAKRRLFTGTFDAIQNQLPDTVLTDNDFLQIRNMLLEKGLESPCSMCYVEGSRAKHGVYVSKWLKEYLKTDPEWRPQIADFTSTTRLEQTRIQHPEAYAAYQKAMNALSQRKPKEASVRTDYKGEILRDFADGTTVAEKNKNGGVRFNSFSDFEIIHALDAMQVITDMARVGLNGQAYTKVKEFAEAFGNTGLKINLSLVAKDVDADGKLIMDETNGMNYAEAMDIRNRYSDNVGTVIVVFNDAQLKAALADSSIDFVLPFHRSQWKKSQYTLMGLPNATRDYTNIQNDRYRNPKTGRAKKAPNGNIMPNEYWDFELSGRENAQKYLDYINENSYIPKFDFLLNRTADGKWTLPEGAVGDGYFKLLIDFKMYNNDGWGAPQNPVVPEFNMPYIQGMLDNYVGGHQSFPVAHDVVSEFVEGKKSGKFSLSAEGETPKTYGNYNVYGKDIALETDEDVAPVEETAPVEGTTSVQAALPEEEDMFPDDYAPMTEEEVAAMNDEALATITDEDAPPVAEQTYDELADSITLEEKPLKQMAKTIAADLGLNRAGKAELERVIQTFSQNEHGTREDLYAEIEKRFGTYNEEHVNEEIADAKAYIRQAKIKVSDTVKSEFGGAKDYLDFMRKHFGAIRFSNDGVGPDQVYMQLNELHPGLFPDDIINPADQMRRIAEVAKTPAKELIPTQLPEEMIQEATDTIYDGITEYKDAERAVAAFDTRVADFAGLMQSADEYAPPAEEDIAPVGEQVETERTQEITEDAAPIKSAPKTTKQPNIIHQGTAEVLTAEPTQTKKQRGLWSWVQEKVFDKGMVFENISKKTNNRELEAKWNYIRYSQGRAQNLIGNGAPADGVKSLDSIVKAVEKTGKTKQFYEYLYHMHNVDRMSLAERYENTPNKAVFGDDVTANASWTAAARLEAQYPMFKEYAKDVYAYNEYLRQMLVDGGVISQETADLWAEMYPHYVPIRRTGDMIPEVNVPLDTNKTGINAPIKQATGGSSDILPLFDTMAQMTMQTYKSIAKNSFGVELKNALGTTIESDVAGVDEVIDGVASEEALLQAGKNGKNPTFTVFEDGERVTFEITEEMYDALKPTSDGWNLTIAPLNKASSFHRGVLTEYNPVFIASNAIKDAQDVLINSQHPAKTYANFPKAVVELQQQGKWYQEYMEHGGEENTYFDSEAKSFDAEEKGAAKLLGIPPLSWISKANNYVEKIPRLAEYIASREAGRSIEVSMLDAARVTTNFAAGGDLTKFLNRNGATFLNASVQGAVQQVRNIREAKMNGLKGWVNLATKFAIAGLPALLLNALRWDDDEEYEELSDYVKENYYVVAKTGDGKFIRIPKGRALAVIQNAFEQVRNAATGDDEVDLKRFLDLAVTNLAPNSPIDNNIIAPIKQVLDNETWYGEDLVPTSLQDLPAAEQFDESTDAISKWLGEKLNISPIKINYLLDQYSGGVGDTILPMLTTEAESGDNSLVGNMLAPIKSKFTTDSVMNNQNVSDFYDMKDELTTNAKASTATDEDVLKEKYMNSINSDLGDLYKKKREAQNSDLPDDEKYALVREIQSEINTLAQNALGSYENINREGDYAEIGGVYFEWYKPEKGDPYWRKLTDDQVTKYKLTRDAGNASYVTDGNVHYRLDEEGKWTKISDKQLERQNEVTQALGITPEEYWSKTDISFMPMSNGEYEYAFDNPGNYAVAKAVGGYDSFKAYSKDLSDIKADKDEDGKSISGSRKNKVIDYINSLDADYGEKIILLKKEYPSEDAYNYDIIDYLNAREDISRDEMIAILRELGFTVYEDGTIEWE